jgi:hypothetical protein
MKINKSDNINFGWSDKTHKYVLSRVIQEFPKLQKYEEILKEFVVRPDYNELGFIGNYHFYSPNTRRSFLDYNGKNNAYVRYSLHVKKMIEAVSIKERDFKIMKHAGKALHFLQDMTQPHHTQEGFFFNKVLEVKTHIDFETFAEKKLNEFLEGSFCSLKGGKSFEDIFLDNVSFSSKIATPTKTNKTEWARIGKAGVLHAYTSTKEFLAKLNDML